MKKHGEIKRHPGGKEEGPPKYVVRGDVGWGLKDVTKNEGGGEQNFEYGNKTLQCFNRGEKKSEDRMGRLGKQRGLGVWNVKRTTERTEGRVL